MVKPNDDSAYETLGERNVKQCMSVTLDEIDKGKTSNNKTISSFPYKRFKSGLLKIESGECVPLLIHDDAEQWIQLGND